VLKIAHRINNPRALSDLSPDLGVEMDLHAYGDRLVVHHDAFADAVDFEEWLDSYRHAFVILNIKEEGIETRVREIVLRRGIDDFFMLDLSFPALIKMVMAGERRVALRVSEYEPAAGALTLAGQAEWVWLDVFHGLPIDDDSWNALRRAGFKLCLVSPELHGRPVDEIAAMRSEMDRRNLTVDAVCTKHPHLW
jgi:hypothetical protein